MFSIKLDIQKTKSNVPSRKPIKVCGRILKPVTGERAFTYNGGMVKALRKFMEKITRFFKKEPAIIVSEFEYFKRGNLRYIGKRTLEGHLQVWGHSSTCNEKMYFGDIVDGKWVRPTNFYHLPYGKRKRSELILIVETEKLTKPYGFQYTHPTLYR